MFTTYIYEPLFQALVFLSEQTGNMGLAIILLTVAIRLILVPLTLPSIKAAAAMRRLKPEIDKLKKKHGKDKAAMQQAQLKLFQENKVNPAAGCLPQIVQLVVLIALYRVFINLLGDQAGSIHVQTQFLWFNVTKVDNTYLLPLMAAFSQLILSLMIIPATDTSAASALAASTPSKKDDKKADDMSEMATTMQQQMMFLMPVMTGFIALKFPSGLALYWVISTIASIAQQYVVSGWGDLPVRLGKLSTLGSKSAR